MQSAFSLAIIRKACHVGARWQSNRFLLTCRRDFLLLCSSAGPNEILMSEPFFEQLKDPPKVDTLDPIQVKGKSKKVPVYRVKR